MSEKTRRFLMVNAFLYLIALLLALKVFDVAEVGPESVRVGLSKVNVWFRNLWNYGEGMDYSRLWYSIAGIISYLCMAVCFFWTDLLFSLGARSSFPCSDGEYCFSHMGSLE